MGFMAQRIGADRRRDVVGSLKLEILSTIYDPWRDDNTIEPRTFEIPPTRTKTLKERLLSKLVYPDMVAREQSVAKAHEKTFHWIFQSEKQRDRPWASFCQWLEAPDKQLYWITGKAGSGKSTLMRFISEPPASDDFSSQPGSPNNEPRCSTFLRRWAGSQPLLIVSFYFWAVGSPMQRSKEGLLRALLYGLLKHVEPAMLASVAPQSWEALCLFDEDPWPYSEGLLHAMLFRALEILSVSHKICIFIDGLDEFEGEQDDLTGPLRDALNAYPIKLCVSSRPWQVFEDAFQDKPSLRLQDLTLADIKTYAQSHLHPEPAFALLRTLEPSFADNLVNNIAMKADGVFLWVHLVVASLQKGIKAGDRVSDLQRRLDLLPRDLEALFERMLDDLDPEYLDHAMHYFQLMEASLSILPLNVMVFSYADEEDEAFGANFPTLPIGMRTFEITRDVMKKRLNSRCMGLLELAEQSEASEGAFVDASRCRVKYLHRTVRDYIASADVQERLNHRARRANHRKFDPHLRLCSAELAFCKTSPIHTAPDSERTPGLPDINDSSVRASFRSLSSCLYHAAEVQGVGLPFMVRLLDALEGVCSEVFSNYRWSNQTFLLVNPRAFRRVTGLTGYEGLYEREEYLFTTLVTQHHVVEYVRTKTYQRPRQVNPGSIDGKIKSAQLIQKWLFSRDRVGRPGCNMGASSYLNLLLYDAVVTTLPCPPIVQLLLERGADPQYTYRGATFKDPSSNWELTLAAYMIESRKQVWERIVKLMIKYGAPVRRRHIYKALRIVRSVSTGVPDGDEAMCAAVEHDLNLMKKEA